MDLSVFQRTIVNEDGTILPVAQIDVYKAGTLVRATLFSDKVGTTPITNPFNADDNGFAQFFVETGNYDVVATLGASTSTWEYIELGRNLLTGIDDYIIATDLVNTEGQDWAGINYVDPDVVGGATNPTAKIYPCGTIVGHTDNYGSYIKYPNGNKEATGTVTPASNANAGTLWTYPIVFNNVLNAKALTDTIASTALGSSLVTEMGSTTVSSMLVKALVHTPTTIINITYKTIYCKVEGN